MGAGCGVRCRASVMPCILPSVVRSAKSRAPSAVPCCARCASACLGHSARAHTTAQCSATRAATHVCATHLPACPSGQNARVACACVALALPDLQTSVHLHCARTPSSISCSSLVRCAALPRRRTSPPFPPFPRPQGPRVVMVHQTPAGLRGAAAAVAGEGPTGRVTRCWAPCSLWLVGEEARIR